MLAEPKSIQNGQGSHLTCHQLPAAHASHVPTSRTFIYVLQLTQEQQLPHRHFSEVQSCSSMAVANLEHAWIFLNPTHWKILQYELVYPARPRSNGYQISQFSSYSTVAPNVYPVAASSFTDRPTHIRNLTSGPVFPDIFQVPFYHYICNLVYPR